MATLARLFHLGGFHRPVSCVSGNMGDVSCRCSARTERSPFGKMLTGGGASFREHRLHRFLCELDRNYFGYDLVFDSTERTGEYRIAFEPLSVHPDQLLPAQLAFLKRTREELPLEQLPTPQIVRLGHPLEVYLATADGKHKIIERIEFS